MIQMQTKERSKPFAYEKTASGDLVIEYGSRKWRMRVDASRLTALIATFAGQRVALGTSRDNPPKGSVGEWLQKHVTKSAVAAYVGPILVREGCAEWEGSRMLRFREKVKYSD